MSFFGTILPGWQRRHQHYRDQDAFGRAWAAVRKNPDAQNWHIDNHVAYGWPRAPYANRGAVTSQCVECDREFTSKQEPTGRGLFCPGCNAFELSHHRSPVGEYLGCPAHGFQAHDFRLSGNRCAHCLKTAAQIAADRHSSLTAVA